MQHHIDDPQYSTGYDAMMQLHQHAIQYGWNIPSPRKIIMQIALLERSAALSAAPVQTLTILGQNLQSPGWYLGRADALRAILHENQENGLE